MGYRIALSFFPLAKSDFSFFIYRRLCTGTDSKYDYPGCRQRKLPDETDSYQSYWVTYAEFEGFEKYFCSSMSNPYLTVDYLHHLLKSNCSTLFVDDFTIEEGFRNLVSFKLKAHLEGNETVWLESYYLKSKKEFGFLADFQFRKDPKVKASRRTLELSLALKNNQTNKDFYSDRFGKISQFVLRFHEKVFPLKSDESHILVEKILREIDSEILNPKVYIFGSEKTSSSQFIGVKNNGPLSVINEDEDIKIYFLYQPQDKPLSHDLFRALAGQTFNTFPGMEKLFKFKMNSSRFGGVSIKGFEPEDLEVACQTIRSNSDSKTVLPVLITPFNKKDFDEQANRSYYLAKHTFLKYGWPSQFVSLDILRNRNALKWAISNIGLGLFAKMGGQPWKVQSATGSCLIVGLGQSHSITAGKITKYFAYSVLTDSSGLYKALKVLGSSSQERDYLSKFKDSLRQLFEQYKDEYSRFVIHATFKIKRKELKALEEVLKEIDEKQNGDNSQKEFIVMKFNEKNDFFGYSKVSNSLIPQESSYLALSHLDYLVWFEGLQRQNPNIVKKIERPVHVEFLYPLEGCSQDQRETCLQEAVNLSGANWRGFNSKSLPVSVYYARLIAKYYQEFRCLNLAEIDLDEIHPWFL